MENEVHTENEAPKPAPWEGARQYVRLTREGYETARKKRLRYLLLYGFIFFLWAAMFFWAVTHAAEAPGRTSPAPIFFLAVYGASFVILRAIANASFGPFSNNATRMRSSRAAISPASSSIALSSTVAASFRFFAAARIRRPPQIARNPIRNWRVASPASETQLWGWRASAVLARRRFVCVEGRFPVRIRTTMSALSRSSDRCPNDLRASRGAYPGSLSQAPRPESGNRPGRSRRRVPRAPRPNLAWS